MSTSKKVQEWRPLELMRDPKVTKFECTDFIGVWQDFVPRHFCENAMRWFDHLYDQGGEFAPDDHAEEFSKIEDEFGPTNMTGFEQYKSEGHIQYKNNLNRRDQSVLTNYCNDGLTYQVNQFLKSCLLHYVTEFGQLKNVPMISSDVKMQKTGPMGGYHQWHYENSAASHSQREVTWMIYLNDIPPEDGGETEFMYQRRRINPTAGTVVFFPAGMTHVHKGNTLLNGHKYILTGWYVKTHLL